MQDWPNTLYPNYPTCNASILPKSYNSLSLSIHHCLIVNTPAVGCVLVVTLATDGSFQSGIVFQTLEVRFCDLTFFSSMASSRSMLSGWALMVWEKKQKVLLDRRASMGTWDQVQGVAIKFTKQTFPLSPVSLRRCRRPRKCPPESWRQHWRRRPWGRLACCWAGPEPGPKIFSDVENI